MHRFTVSRTTHPGGAWLVLHTSDESIPGDPFADPQKGRHLAFTTLAHARTYISSVVRYEKRVRMVKHSDDLYTYER